jgi:hypothetical protein
LIGFILITLIFHYSNRINLLFYITSIAYIIFNYSMLFIFDFQQVSLFYNFTIPIFAASRLPQIYNNFKVPKKKQYDFMIEHSI